MDLASIVYYYLPVEGFVDGVGGGRLNTTMSQADLETWIEWSPQDTPYIFKEYPFLMAVEGCLYEEYYGGAFKWILVDDQTLYFQGKRWASGPPGRMRKAYNLHREETNLRYDCEASTNQNIIFINGVDSEHTAKVVQFLKENRIPHEVGNR